jgi:hypothetical protein
MILIARLEIDLRVVENESSDRVISYSQKSGLATRPRAQSRLYWTMVSAMPRHRPANHNSHAGGESVFADTAFAAAHDS